MTRKSYLSGAAAGALAAVFVAFGGMGVSAMAQPGAAVNGPSAATPAAGAPTSFADIVQRVAPAVVSIEVEVKPDATNAAFPGRGPFSFRFGAPGAPDDGDQDNNDNSQPRLHAAGSGFFISADGYIVTNNHVVEHADKITVHTKDDRTLQAHLVGTDPATDLAVVKVDGAGFDYVSFEDKAKPRVGDWVVAVGNPFGLGGTATAGIVSAIGRRNVSDSSYVDYMQIDAPINRGNSGGPTFDMSGRVVGVNTAIFSPTGGSVGIGFDIPADVAQQVAEQLIAHGQVVRGYIGATVQDLTPEIADSLGLGGRKGALVADLTPGGPSAMAGLKPGDVILKANGQAVTGATDLTRLVGAVHGGDTVKLDVNRDGKPIQIAVRSGVRPSEAVLAKADYQQAGPGASSDDASVLGMRLKPNAKGGLTVEGLTASSDAAQKGLRRGDVILKVGGRDAATVADAAQAVADAKKDGREHVLLFVSREGQHIFLPVKVGKSADEG